MDEALEFGVCGESYTVTAFLKAIAQSDEWLDVSSAAYHLDHDVQAERKLVCCGVAFVHWRWEGGLVVVIQYRYFDEFR